jgi:tRNA-specific 2-thiouridylase
MPLGHLSGKQETRRIAAERGLALANKPDSQEICFVPREGYVTFLSEKAPAAARPGKIVDTAGNVLGEHLGVAFYTVGQRKRLPASPNGPLFVLALDAETNTVVVGRDEELYAPGFVASDCTWSAIERPDRPLAAQVKIRYNGQAATAVIGPGERPEEIEGRFEVPQRAVTPGQAAVFYGGEGEEAGQVVLGGGTIERAFIPQALPV